MFNMPTAFDTAHVKSVLRLLQNMLQHVLSSSLQCGGVSLLTTCLAQKRPDNSCQRLRRTCYLHIIAAMLFTNMCATLIVSMLVALLNACNSVLNNTFPSLLLIFPSIEATSVFQASAKQVVTTSPFSRVCHWPTCFRQRAMRSSLQQQLFSL